MMQGEKRMNQKKALQELTFKDNFMFGAVLLDPINCKNDQDITMARLIWKFYLLAWSTSYFQIPM